MSSSTSSSSSKVESDDDDDNDDADKVEDERSRLNPHEAGMIYGPARRLQLIWNEKPYVELTKVANRTTFDSLRRGLPVIKYCRNKTAAIRTLYITKDSARVSSLSTFSPSPTNSSSLMKDDDIEDNAQWWLELRHRRGSITASSKASSGGLKRFRLSQVFEVRAGRKTEAFRNSQRQSIPASDQEAKKAPLELTIESQRRTEARSLPGGEDLCLSLFVPEEIATADASLRPPCRSIDLEFRSEPARDAALRFFRGQVRRNEIRAARPTRNSSVAPTVEATHTTTAVAVPSQQGGADSTTTRRSTKL